MNRIKLIFAIAGTGLVVWGTFVPALDTPDTKSAIMLQLSGSNEPPEIVTTNYYQLDAQNRRFDTGRVEVYTVLVLAGVSLIAAVFGRFRLLWITGAGLVLSLGFSLTNLQLRKNEVIAKIEGNPIEDAILEVLEYSRIRSAWWVMFAGAACILTAAAIPRRADCDDDADDDNDDTDGLSGTTQRVVRYQEGVGMIPKATDD